MAKQTKPKICCPTPFPIREIVWGETNTPTTNTYFELREDGGKELREDNSEELREY
jgi:hypothetical protein